MKGVLDVYLLHVNLANLQTRKMTQLSAYDGIIVPLQYLPAWANWLLILGKGNARAYMWDERKNITHAFSFSTNLKLSFSGIRVDAGRNICNMAKKSSQPALQAFVNWYNSGSIMPPSKRKGNNVMNNPPTGRQPLTPQRLKGILAALSLSNTKQNVQDVTDAYNFLMDNHQWYLNVSAVSARDQVIDILIKAKPWANTQLKNKPFVDLFQYFQNLLSPNGVLIKFIGQLTVYDLAMRIALMNSSALPTEVYVHAKPLIAAKQMAKKGYISAFNPFVIPASNFVGAFGNMAPCDIEDLLCHIGKSIERVKNGVKGKNQAQIDIDK